MRFASTWRRAKRICDRRPAVQVGAPCHTRFLKSVRNAFSVVLQGVRVGKAILCAG